MIGYLSDAAFSLISRVVDTVLEVPQTSCWLLCGTSVYMQPFRINNSLHLCVWPLTAHPPFHRTTITCLISCLPASRKLFVPATTAPRSQINFLALFERRAPRGARRLVHACTFPLSHRCVCWALGARGLRIQNFH